MAGLIAGIAVLGLAAAATPPLGLMAVFVVLGGRRPIANGVAFLAGWVLVLSSIVLVSAFVLNGRITPNTKPTTAVLWGTVALGVGSLIAAHVLRRRATLTATETSQPPWLDKLTDVGPKGSFIAGVSTPSYPAAIAAGTDLIRAQVGNGGRLLALAVFIVIATVIEAVPVVLQAINPDRAQATIARWRGAVIARRSLVVYLTLVVLGIYLVASGIVDLVRL